MKNTCGPFRRLNRREFLRIGGASLCGVSLLDVLRARAGADDLPTFATLGKIDHHINNAIAGSFLGPAYNPLIFDPTQSRDDIARMLTPQIELPSFQRDADLLRAVDNHLRRQDALDPVIAGL